jgi:hypothetical protein
MAALDLKPTPPPFSSRLGVGAIYDGCIITCRAGANGVYLANRKAIMFFDSNTNQITKSKLEVDVEGTDSVLDVFVREDRDTLVCAVDFKGMRIWRRYALSQYFNGVGCVRSGKLCTPRNNGVWIKSVIADVDDGDLVWGPLWLNASIRVEGGMVTSKIWRLFTSVIEENMHSYKLPTLLWVMFLAPISDAFMVAVAIDVRSGLSEQIQSIIFFERVNGNVISVIDIGNVVENLRLRGVDVVNNGNRVVRSMCVDKRGYIWLSTLNGYVRVPWELFLKFFPRRLAFAMGLHPRLGAGSAIQLLTGDLARKIMDDVYA